MPTYKPCRNEEIRSPLTNRCVDINGKTFTQKILPHLQNVGLGVISSQRDKQLIRNRYGHVLEQRQVEVQSVVPSVLPLPSVTLPFVQHQAEPIRIESDIMPRTPEDELWERVSMGSKEKVKELIRHWKTRAYPFVTNAHKNKCKDGGNVVITPPFPIVYRTVELTLPYVDFTNIKHTFKDYLGKTRRYKFAKDIPHTWKEVKMEMEQDTFSTDILHVFKIDSWKTWETPQCRQWLIDYSQWTLALPLKDFFCILSYTYHAMKYINLYLYEKTIGHFDKCLHNIRTTSLIYYNHLYWPIQEKLSSLSNVELLDVLLQNADAFEVFPILQRFKQNGNYLDFRTIVIHLKDDILLEAYEQWANDLQRILSTAPPITFPMTVFRGHRQQFIRTKKGRIYKSPTFLSTSLDPFHSIKYTHSRSDSILSRKYERYLTRIVLPIGTRVLWVEGMTFYKKEKEIVLPMNSSFYIMQHHHVSWPIPTTLQQLKTHIRQTCPKFSGKNISIIEMMALPKPHSLRS